MKLLLLVLCAWAGLIEPAGKGEDRRGEPARRSEPAPRPAPQAAPVAPAPSAAPGQPLIVPAPQQPAPAPQPPPQVIYVDPAPHHRWRPYHGYFWDPHDHYWYRWHHGYWWRHDPVYERWVVYETPAQYAAQTSARSADGRRVVEVTAEGDAYLFDSSYTPPRLIKRLEAGVEKARFSDGTILLDMRDGTFKLYDYEGRPLPAPSGRPPLTTP